MTSEETFLLTEYVRACCPQQHMGEYTPDAWHDLLGDLDLADCRAAVTAVAKRQPFVAPAEIRAEVRRIRDDRLARTALPAPPPDAADEPGRYKEIIRANVKRIADARSVPRALAAGPLPGDPPAEWQEARAAMRRPEPPAVDPRQKAREQVEEARRAREAGELA
jgi:hypothetical protein